MLRTFYVKKQKLKIIIQLMLVSNETGTCGLNFFSLCFVYWFRCDTIKLLQLSECLTFNPHILYIIEKRKVCGMSRGLDRVAVQEVGPVTHSGFIVKLLIVVVFVMYCILYIVSYVEIKQ